MKIVVVLVLLLLTRSVVAQVSQDPEFYYSNFEFEDAANLWEKQAKVTTLSREQRMKLLDCYVVIERSNSGLTLVDALLREKEELSLLKSKAQLLFQLKEFEEANTVAQSYRSNGGVELSPLFEANCEYSSTNTRELKGTVVSHALNTKRAESLLILNGDEVLLREIGLDSVLKNAEQTKNFEEVFFLRPFIRKNGDWKPWPVFDDKQQYWSLNSIQIDESKGLAYFSATQPLTAQSSKLYVAKFNGFESSLTEIQSLDFDGALKKASAGQIALSPDGTWMIFSAITETTLGADLMQAHWVDGKWQLSTNLSLLNSAQDELFPILTAGELRFSTDGRAGFGGLDIWSMNWSNGVLSAKPWCWSMPVNSPGDDFLLYGESGDTLQFSSNRASGKGDDDAMIFCPKIDVPVVDSMPGVPVVEVIPNIPTQRLYFGFDFDVTNDVIKYIGEMSMALNAAGRAKIVVTGHTDSQGSAIYNVDLAMRRAMFVKQRLISMGIPENRIVVYSKGEERSATSNHRLKSEFAKDRFVEIDFLNL